MPNTFVTTQPIGVQQPEPPEGRRAFPLIQPPLTFATGAEVFEWQSNSLGAGAPRSILGAWVDATGMSGLAATDGITVTFNSANGNSQTFFVPSGSQGYVVPIQQTPVNVLVKSAGSSTGLAVVTLYNYNPLFTGVGGAAAPAITNAGSQSGQTGNASGRNAPHVTRQFPIQRP